MPTLPVRQALHFRRRQTDQFMCLRFRSIRQAELCRRPVAESTVIMGVSRCVKAIFVVTVVSLRPLCSLMCSGSDRASSFSPRCRTRCSAPFNSFAGSTAEVFGDPRMVEWATGANDARHAFVFQGGMYIPKVGSVTAFSRIQSGLPFTPIVQGDVNGDGRTGDRAFIPDPQSASTSAELRGGMAALLESTSDNVRDCLARQFGSAAGRNSCRGPWTQQLNIQWTPRLPLTVQGAAGCAKRRIR